MRRPHRLSQLLAHLRLTPEERDYARAEECMEALFDSPRCACGSLGEREQAELEAERRRWAHVPPSNSSDTVSSTGL
jgi:hypothetical protein